MIALPFGKPGSLGDFRLLLNQANETLNFDLFDLGVPNRGANKQDQHLAALRYLQALDQVAAIDGASDDWLLAHLDQLDQEAITHISRQTIATIQQALTPPLSITS